VFIICGKNISNKTSCNKQFFLANFKLIVIYPVLVALKLILQCNDSLQVANLLLLHTFLLKPAENRFE
jgi:hypothetical protein